VLTDAFVESVLASGYPFNPDYNGATQQGVGYLQFTQRLGLRWNAADAFLRPLLGRKNFKLLLNTTADKIELAKGRATAVSFRHGGVRHQEMARDIVLSAGVINSPKLLMLSGIGDSEDLRRHKIPVVHHLPAVGHNLKEHPLVQLSYRTTIPSYNLTEGLAQRISIAGKYLLFREGPIAAAYEAAAFLETQPSAPMQDVQVFFAPIGWTEIEGQLKLASHSAVKICVIRSHSISAGRVRLRSLDPDDPPMIECQALESQGDLQALVDGIQTVRAIMKTSPISRLIESEIAPGPTIKGADALRRHLRSHTILTCHPIGTCRMGTGPDSVVGPDLRVLPVENLWIADASVMPDHISANLNAPCMMIGAKLGKQLAARK
jgi:choline dehydrogenase-like flavoprotein